MKNDFDLTGRVAMVTGASSGLGADAALAYARHGADVALLARRVDRLNAVAAEIESMGRRALAVACDITDEEQIKSAVCRVAECFGRIDILLNNAGVATAGAVDELSADDWDKGMNTNLKGMFMMSKYVVPYMRERRYGRIVNVASINAVIATKNKALARHVYNASKAGVRGLTIGMAATYGEDNITVNSVGPGLFESEMTESTLFANPQFMQIYNALNPMGRPGRRGELNGTIIYFSSDAASYVTGQHIIVDGGTSIV